MARSRMINKALISKDCFLQLSCATQLLYFHLCLNADDDGFVDNAITLIRQLPVNIEDLKTLIEKGYVLLLEDYLYVITHWRMHNRIDKNHYTGTAYVDYMKKLFLDDNNVYSLSKGTNLFDFQRKRGFIEELEASKPELIEDDVKKKLTSNCSQNEFKKSTNCTQNVLKKNSECEQKEPQLSKGKVSIVKDSKVKLSKEDQTIRAFLDSHNLSSIDSRYEKKLYNFFREQNKDTEDCVGYCQYVYDYLNTSHKSVDAKLFFTVSLKPDVLIRFLNNKNVKNQKRSDYWDIWPDKCPVCERNHFKNQPNGDCPLDMSKENSAETIEAAKKIYEKTQVEAIRNLTHFREILKKE